MTEYIWNFEAVKTLLNKVQSVQVSDTTGDAISNAACKQKIIFF